MTFLLPPLSSNMQKIAFMNSALSSIYNFDASCHNNSEFNTFQHICTSFEGYDKSLEQYDKMIVSYLCRLYSLNAGSDVVKLIVKFSAIGKPYQPESTFNKLAKRGVNDILSPALFGIAVGLLRSVFCELADQRYSYSFILLTMALVFGILGGKLSDAGQKMDNYNCLQASTFVLGVTAMSFFSTNFLDSYGEQESQPECDEILPGICLEP